MPIQIEAPNLAQSGLAEEVSVDQQVQGAITDGLACVRFSNSDTGPWVTARPDAGPVRCDVGPWSAQDTTFVWDVIFYENVWIQFAVWDVTSQPHSDEPVMVSDNVVRVRVLTSREAVAPDREA